MDYGLLAAWQLERKVVGAAVVGGRCAEWVGLRLSCCGRSGGELCGGNGRVYLTWGGRVYLSYVESSDAVEPTAVVFVSVNVKRYVHLLTYLYAEALKTVCTEDRENHLLRICVVCLKNKVLSCPFATSGCATARVECHNDFSL